MILYSSLDMPNETISNNDKNVLMKLIITNEIKFSGKNVFNPHIKIAEIIVIIHIGYITLLQYSEMDKFITELIIVRMPNKNKIRNIVNTG